MADTAPAPDAAPQSDRSDVVRYFDGSRWLYCDMHRVYRQLHHASGYRMAELQEAVKAEDKAAAAEAVGELLGAVRQAFGLPAFDQDTGQGATDQNALDAYGLLLEGMKKQGKEAPGAAVATP